MTEPATQTVHVSGFDGTGFGNVGGPKEMVELLAMLNSQAGRRALHLGMLAADTPRETLERVLVFCKAKSKEELFQGEPFLWLKRLIARANNVRMT